MTDTSGPKLGSKVAAETRIRVARRVVDRQVTAENAASTLGVTRQAVLGWAKRLREKGADDLLDKPVSGRPPKLSDGDAADLYARIANHSPRDWGLPSALWSRKMVCQLIKNEYGVDLSLQSIGYLLRAMGLSTQRPVFRAYQQDPEAVKKWTNVTYPAIASEAKAAGAAVMFADEAAVRSDYHAGTTWGPVGQTPVVTKTGDRFTVNMISAVGARGDFHFSLIDGSCNSSAFIDYCRGLLSDVGRPIFLIVDGSSYHDSIAVREFVASTEDRLRLFRLPGYSPELNPDERVWRNLKAHTIARLGITTLEEMVSSLYAAADRLYSVPAIVRGFFKDPELAYIETSL
jgi:transposase